MDTTLKIQEFINMPEGWIFGVSKKISQDTIDVAIQINELAENYGLETEAFPGMNGEIMLSVDGWDGKSLEFIIYYSDIQYSTIDDNSFKEYEEFINFEDVQDLIEDLANVEA